MQKHSIFSFEFLFFKKETKMIHYHHHHYNYELKIYRVYKQSKKKDFLSINFSHLFNHHHFNTVFDAYLFNFIQFIHRGQCNTCE